VGDGAGVGVAVSLEEGFGVPQARGGEAEIGDKDFER